MFNIKPINGYFWLLIILISILTLSCSGAEGTSNPVEIKLQTIDGALLSDIDANEYCLKLVGGSSQETFNSSGVTAYFSSDRSGTSYVYRSIITNGGLFTSPSIVNIEYSSAPIPIRFFTIVPNATILGNSDMVIYSDGNNKVYKSHPDISSQSFEVANASGSQLNGIVLGILPPGADFSPSFTIPDNDFGLVIVETNSTGEYKKIAVYSYSTNLSVSANIMADSDVENFPVDNEILYGGGSWVPGSIIGKTTDFFLHSKKVGNVHDVFITDFISSDIKLSLFSSAYDDSSPFYSRLDDKLYFTSKAYTDLHNFNMFRWNFLGIAPYLLTVLETGNITPTLDTTRPVVSITSPTNTGSLEAELGQPITGTASDDTSIVAIWISISNTSPPTNYGWYSVTPQENWSFSSSFFSGDWPDSAIRDIHVYAIDAAGNFSLTNTVNSVFNPMAMP